MRFVTFNVCGLKNVLDYSPWCENKSYEFMFNLLKADIICLQETKMQPKDLTPTMAKVPNFNAFYTFSTSKKGYSGVAIYVRDSCSVYKAEEGLTGWLNSNDVKNTPYRNTPNNIGGYPSIDKKEGLSVDSEGRTIVLDLDWCVVIGLYCPANTSEDRDDYRQNFYNLLNERIENLLNEGRHVVVLGDINVARDLIDSADGIQNLAKEKQIKSTNDGQEFCHINQNVMKIWRESTIYRQIINNWCTNLEMQDTTRDKHPTRLNMYTCWNVKLNARPGNFGSRIDYIFASKGLYCESADIRADVYGSDHCPVFADITLLSTKHNVAESAVVAAAAEPEKNTQQPKLPKLCAAYQFNTQSLKLFFAKKMPSDKQQSVNKVTKPVIKKPKQSTLLNYFQNKPVETVINKEESTSTPIDDIANLTDSPDRSVNNSHISELNNDDVQKQQVIISKNIESSTKQQWREVFKQQEPPFCKIHQEPCKKMITKKKGINKGRAFWVCSRYV